LVDLFECMMMHGLTNPKFKFITYFNIYKIEFSPTKHLFLLWALYLTAIILQEEIDNFI